MCLAITQIWYSIDKKVPFAVRKVYHPLDSITIITEVKCDNVTGEVEEVWGYSMQKESFKSNSSMHKTTIIRNYDLFYWKLAPEINVDAILVNENKSVNGNL